MFAITSQSIIEGLGSEITFYIFSGTCIVGSFAFCFVMKEIKGMTKE